MKAKKNLSPSKKVGAAAPKARGTLASKVAALQERFKNLTRSHQQVMRWVAFVGQGFSKYELAALMSSAHALFPDRTPRLSIPDLQKVLIILRDQGVLRDTVESMTFAHQLVRKTMEDPAQAKFKACLATLAFSTGRGSVSGQDALAAKMALYDNDTKAYAKSLERMTHWVSYSTHISPADALFPVRLLPDQKDWFASRAPAMQSDIVWAKIQPWMTDGSFDPELPLLFHHCEQVSREPGHQILLPLAAIFHCHFLDIASLRLDAELMLEHGLLERGQASLGIAAFLSGDNDSALTAFREALRLIRKRTGKRKITLPFWEWLFFLLALARRNGNEDRKEAEASLAAADFPEWFLRPTYIALSALFSLLGARHAEASGTIRKLDPEGFYPPLVAPLIELVRLLADPDMAQKHAAQTARRYDQFLESMPIAACILADVLAEIRPDLDKASTWRAQHSQVVPFTAILERQAPWERSLEAVAAFLSTGHNPAKARALKQKRLVWMLDVKTGYLEPREQSLKGRGASAQWSPGKSLSLKSLKENNAGIDYLTDEDRRVIRHIIKDSGWGYRGRSVQFRWDLPKALRDLVGHPQIFDQSGEALSLDLLPPELLVEQRTKGYSVRLSHDATHFGVQMKVLGPGRIGLVDITPRMAELAVILGPKGLHVPVSGENRILELLQFHHPELPVRASISAVDLSPEEVSSDPVVQLRRQGDGLHITIAVRPLGLGGQAVTPGHGSTSLLMLREGRPHQGLRHLEAEQRSALVLVEACSTLRESAIQDGAWRWTLDGLEASLDFLLELQACQVIHTVEWPLGDPLRLSAPVSAQKLSLRVRQGKDWFQVRGEVQVDENQVVDMARLMEGMAAARGRFVPMEDGRFLALTSSFKRQMDRLRAASEAEKGGRRLHPLGALAVQELLDEVEEAGGLAPDQAWTDWAARIRAAGAHQPIIPRTLQAELRDYQREGFEWLSRLAHWGVGACLADDMGLGKTVQAIAVMLERAARGPALVVAPTSVCGNWETELHRFAPTLKAHRLTAAPDRAALIKTLGPLDVLIISYGILRLETPLLSGISWQMVVFDEAQALKNAETKRARASKEIPADFRLALTGTPIENYLEELWSLFNTITPGLLGSREAFNRRFVAPIAAGNSGARQTLKALLRPFILRRLKSAVLEELPPRTEQNITVELASEERALYEAVRRKALESLAADSPAEPGQRKLHILAELTRLRRACCHPALIDPESVLPGAKLQHLLELARDLARNGHKALIFSQFVGFLQRVFDALVAAGFTCLYLDGSTPEKERSRRVSAFQAGEGDFFCISLRAGGQGLNLTAADYVIHLDPWWNPAVEDQASDRAHRIGQERPVTIYRLVVQDSIEEKILAMHQDKRGLADELLEGASTASRLSEEELLALFAAGGLTSQ